MNRKFKTDIAGIVIKFVDNFKASPKNGIKSNQRETLKGRAEPSITSQKIKVFDHEPFKNKHIYGHMPTVMYT